MQRFARAGILAVVLTTAACNEVGKGVAEPVTTEGRATVTPFVEPTYTTTSQDQAATRPDPALSPGGVFATATTTVICRSGYSRTVRNVTTATRRQVFTSYGIAYPPPAGKYELDHLIPLELGGNNTAANLWPEIYHGAGSADVKDHLENHLRALVCSGQVSLRTAQQGIAGDWFATATKYNPIAVRAVAPSLVPVPVPVRTTPAASVRYANCSAARAAGAAPIHEGQPGYRSGLDRDHDGIACE
ncbi:MAG: endonuclease [Frankiales bacterium]|nr:endonuclease [Frankiales bacterium]